MSNQFELFTAEQDEWIIEHYNDKPLTELLALFNEKFGQNRSYAVLKQRCRKTLHLKHYTLGENYEWLPEHDEWLRANIDGYSRKELTDAFNKRFGKHKSEASIKHRCNCDLGLKFTDNRERYLNAKRVDRQAVGTLIHRKNGQWVVKIGTHQYKQAGRYYWEQKYGEIPKGYQVVHLDHDIGNNNISNLYCTTGKVIREMSKNSWWFDNPLLTLTALKYCELHYLVKDSKHGTVL